MTAAQFLDGPASAWIIGSCTQASHYFSIILNVTFSNRYFPVILTITAAKLP
jgi:hypothetical protein